MGTQYLWPHIYNVWGGSIYLLCLSPNFKSLSTSTSHLNRSFWNRLLHKCLWKIQGTSMAMASPCFLIVGQCGWQSLNSNLPKTVWWNQRVLYILGKYYFSTWFRGFDFFCITWSGHFPMHPWALLMYSSVTLEYNSHSSELQCYCFNFSETVLL